MDTNRDAFEDIVAKSRVVVISAARRYLGPSAIDDVDDVAQDVYVALYGLWQRGKLAQVQDSANYIFTLTKHHCLRHNKRQGRFQPLDVDVEDVSTALSTDDKEALNQAIQQLPDTYRVLVGYVLQGYGLTELSQKLSIKLGTIKSQMSRARQHLSRLLKEGRG